MTFGRHWVLAAGLAIGAFEGCHATVRSTDGNTSWLETCTTSADCDGLDCECGVCTRSCTTSTACTDRTCAKPGSRAFEATCGGGASRVGVCLPPCGAKGCGPGNTCIDGQCAHEFGLVPDSGAPPPSDDAGRSMPPDQGSGGVPGFAGAGGMSAGGGLLGAGGSGALGAGGSGALGAGGSGAFGAGGSGAFGALGAGGAFTSGCPPIDFSSYATGETISFRNDVLPMLGLSCVAADCHGAYETAPRAGLNLGNKCVYDMNAKWKCTFPNAADPLDPTKPAPDLPIANQIYASMMEPATTVVSPRVRRIVPGDPANSYLMLTLADQQNTRGYTCENQDPSHESNPPPCGVSMPQNQDLYCQGTYRPRFDAIARWIAEGAPNN